MNIRQKKNKAVKHQNEIRKLILAGFYGYLEDGDVTARPMNNHGSDIILSPKATKIFPFYVECKRYEDKSWKYSCKDIYNDTKEKALKEGLIPILIRKKSYANNQFYTDLDFVLQHYSRILLDVGLKLKYYPTKRDLMILSIPSLTSMCSSENVVHFGEKQFFILMSCLKKSFFQ